MRTREPVLAGVREEADVCPASRRLQCFDPQGDQRWHNQKGCPLPLVPKAGAENWPGIWRSPHYIRTAQPTHQTALVLWAITPSLQGHLSQKYCSHLLTRGPGVGLQPRESGCPAPGCSDCKTEWKSGVQPKASAAPMHRPAPGGQGAPCWPAGHPCLGRHKEGLPSIYRCLLIK